MPNITRGEHHWCWYVIGILVLPAPELLSQQQPESVLIDNARPVHAMARDLEVRYGWRITYEDPPYTNGEGRSYLQLPLAERASDLQPRIPNSRPVRFNFAIRNYDQEGKHQALALILDQHHSSGNPGRFGLSHNADFSHIVPLSARSSDGGTVPFQSLLDTPVSISVANGTVGEIVASILSQVSGVRGVPIAQGAVPVTMFLNERQSLSESGLSARELLIELFERLSNRSAGSGLLPRRVTWDLLYEISEGTYYFNAHVIARDRGTQGQAAARTNRAGLFR